MMAAAAATQPSIWGEVSAGELILMAIGVLFTLGLLAVFVLITVRASRTESDKSLPRDGHR